MPYPLGKDAAMQFNCSSNYKINLLEFLSNQSCQCAIYKSESINFT